MNRVKVKVVSGDISRVPADALITAINSSGLWFGGIDDVIRRSAGNFFHHQAVAAMPLTDGKVIVARSDRTHGNTFRNVIFVVDDLKKKLSEVICNGLRGASDAGFETVSLPTIRMGVMLGVVEKTASEAVREMTLGVLKFVNENPNTSVKQLTFVVYNDATVKSLLEEDFGI